jgi:MFS family permease
MLTRIQTTYREFPLPFRVLVGAAFIDRLGGTMLFPFFALYVTEKFNVGMTEAGLLLGIFSLAGLVGGMVGGALTDKIGRRSLVIFGLISSALGSVAMGFVTSLPAFYALAVVVGFLGDIAGPAHGAMVADMLPEEQRSEGFGVLRIVGNLAWIIGPTIGGVLALRSYTLLFITDAVTSLITAGIVYRLIPETKPAATEHAKSESLLRTVIGYREVARDRLYMAFLLTSVLMLLVYQQMYSTLSVYLRDVHGVPARGYGLLMSIDAALVVVAQLPVARRVKNYPPMLMMALGTAFYMVGFTIYGFVSTYVLFIAAILLITVGEMIVLPVGQALAARFAPEAMRGRYMAFFGFSWALPGMVSAWAAGMIMDNYNPNWVWYLCGIISAVAVTGFCGLYLATRARFQTASAAIEPAQP